MMTENSKAEYHEGQSNAVTAIRHMISTQCQNAKNFLTDSKFKFNHLEETNMEVGLAHLRAGNWKDARFRFWFMSKVWSDNLEARYLLALSQFACMKTYLMRPVLVSILEENHDYTPARELLQKLDNKDYDGIRRLLGEYIAHRSMSEQEQAKVHALYGDDAEEKIMQKTANAGPQQE